MKKSILNIALSTLIVFLACCPKEDSLDAIKSFKPDNKYFKAGLVSLHFITETSSIGKIDTVFSQMIRQNNLPTDATGCADGIYEGESLEDAYDYKHWARLEIKDEKIVSIDYNEIHTDGHGKQEDEEYCKMMQSSGTDPSIAYPMMEKELLEKQSILKIDGVSGASYSNYRFRYAVMIALMKARLERLAME